MKRVIAALLVLALLASMSACKAKPKADSVPESAAQPAPESVSEAEEKSVSFPEEMVGSWILVDSNDTALTEKTFPGVTEKGGTMEIDENGMMTWTIGADSGSGKLLEVVGDEVSAQFRAEGADDPVSVRGLLENSTEAFAFYLNYSGVDLIWVHLPPQ